MKRWPETLHKPTTNSCWLLPPVEVTVSESHIQRKKGFWWRKQRRLDLDWHGPGSFSEEVDSNLKSAKARTDIEVGREDVWEFGDKHSDTAQCYHGHVAGWGQALEKSGLNCVGDWRVSEQMNIMKTKIVMGRWGSRREPGRWHRSGSGQRPQPSPGSAGFHTGPPLSDAHSLTSALQCACVCVRVCVRELDRDWNETSQSVTAATF